MAKHNQDGAANGLVIALVLAVILLIGAVAFGGWAYNQMTQYRDDSDAMSQAAVEVAVQKESAKKDKEHAEKDKEPLRVYTGPAAYGSLHVEYPKTWSAYVDDTSNVGTNVNGYFNPGVVPSTQTGASVFALRVQVTNTPYTSELQLYSSQLRLGKLKISAYSLPRLPKVVGIRATGQTSDGKDANIILLPLRSGSIKIWTEGTQSLADFNKFILPNITFSP